MIETKEKKDADVTLPIQASFVSSGLECSYRTEMLDEALAKAQGEIKPALKDAKNPHFKSTYANIASTIEVIRAPLAKYGVNVTQWPMHSTDDRLHLLTRIACAGQFIQAVFSAPVVKKDPQGYGSALTYLRRYALQAILGIPTEDDDGEAASGRGQSAPKESEKKIVLNPVRINDLIQLLANVELRLTVSDFIVQRVNTDRDQRAIYNRVQALLPRLNKVKITPDNITAIKASLIEELEEAVKNG